MQEFTNKLINESSPYLLQHAHNPVNWFAWNTSAWEKAMKEDKLVIISVGYSSCHWCHVMEHETFEDIEAAKVMNDNFISIKVDREERPDIDHIYMSAVQLMTGQGGWPLNCICLPNGKPIYGGTYFPKANWIHVLNQLKEFYTNNREKAEEYADELTNGVQQMETVIVNEEPELFSREVLSATVNKWKQQFDLKEGGPNRAPKFPMPNNYEFLLRYAVAEKDESLKEYVLLTLDKMALGGIYDQVGGGFARYSTDIKWKVPHFEKMLYDNAQLVSLYSEAYKLTKKPLYKNVVEETLEFIQREMTSSSGGFYAALDADSEGEEGKFYVWKKEEFGQLLGDHFPVVADYFRIDTKGYWEHDNYILLRTSEEETVASKHNLNTEQLQQIISDSKKILLQRRNERVRPGLDNKEILSWNALMISGYCKAYEAFGIADYLNTAIRCSEYILDQRRKQGTLQHVPGKTPVFLEDYSFFIEALVDLYQVTFQEKYLLQAKELAKEVIEKFYDKTSGMFFFTPGTGEQLIARKKEIHDNVIPASNSSMAKGLFLLGKFFNKKSFLEISHRMLQNVQKDIPHYGSSFSNWCILFMSNVFPFYEIVITGKEAEERRADLTTDFLPAHVLAGSIQNVSSLPLLKGRQESETRIFICENFECKLPVTTIHQALLLMQ